MVELLENAEYPFFAIASRLTLTRSGIIWQDPINESNRTVSHYNSMQTNDFYKIELFEIKLSDCLTVGKQMYDV